MQLLPPFVFFYHDGIESGHPHPFLGNMCCNHGHCKSEVASLLSLYAYILFLQYSSPLWFQTWKEDDWWILVFANLLLTVGFMRQCAFLSCVFTFLVTLVQNLGKKKRHLCVHCPVITCKPSLGPSTSLVFTPTLFTDERCWMLCPNIV